MTIGRGEMAIGRGEMSIGPGEMAIGRGEMSIGRGEMSIVPNQENAPEEFYGDNKSCSRPSTTSRAFKSCATPME